MSYSVAETLGTSGGSGSTSGLVNVSSATAGHLLYIVVAVTKSGSSTDPAIGLPVDNLSGTWTQLGSEQAGTGNQWISRFYKAAAGGEDQVQVSWTGSATNGWWFEYDEISGFSGTPTPLTGSAASNSATSTSTGTCTSGSCTPHVGDCVIEALLTPAGSNGGVSTYQFTQSLVVTHPTATSSAGTQFDVAIGPSAGVASGTYSAGTAVYGISWTTNRAYLIVGDTFTGSGGGGTTANAGLAAVTVAGKGPTTTDTPSAGLAAVTVAGLAPTISGTTTANAGLAAVTVTALTAAGTPGQTAHAGLAQAIVAAGALDSGYYWGVYGTGAGISPTPYFVPTVVPNIGTAGGLGTPTSIDAENGWAAFVIANIVYGVGGNGDNQLDNTANASYVTPTNTTTGTGGSNHPVILQIDGGNQSAVGVDPSGTIWAWGNNLNGQMGNNTGPGGVQAGKQTVNAIGNGLGGTTTALKVSAGGGHVIALLPSGQAVGWGDDQFGQLGDGNNGSGGGSGALNVLFPNLFVQGVGGGGVLTGVTDISCGHAESFALLSNGTIAAWGYNKFGQMGQNTSGTGNQVQNVPVLVLGPSGTGALGDGTVSPAIVKISGGGGGNSDGHVLALDSSGHVWAWGCNLEGQIGNNNAGTNALLPVDLVAGSYLPETCIAVSAGAQHSLALGKSGVLYAWGDNSVGELGLNNTTQYNTPQVVGFFTGQQVKQIFAGNNVSIADAFASVTGVTDTPSAGKGGVTVAGLAPTPQVVANAGLAAVVVAALVASPSVPVVANAGLAAVTVAGQAPTTTDTPGAGLAAVTVAGLAPTGAQAGLAGLAAVIIAAQSPTTTDTPGAGLASVTVAGQAPTTQDAPGAGLAAVIVSGLAPVGTIGGLAGLASVTVAGLAPTVADSANAALAAVTPAGLAPGSTDTASAALAAVTVAGQAPTTQVVANAGLAAVAVAALAPSGSAGATANAGLAAVTVAGQAPTTQATTTAGLVTVTVAGLAPNITTSSAAGLAAVTVAGLVPTSQVVASSGLSTVTVAAIQPNTGGATTANAGLAAVTVIGLAPTTTDSPTAGLAAVTVAALAPADTDQAPAALAAVTVGALAPTSQTTASAGLAAVTIAALAPSISGSTVANAAVAQVAASGLTPQSSITTAAPLAAVTITGLAPTNGLGVPSGLPGLVNPKALAGLVSPLAKAGVDSA